jgi:hypothetical protein
MKKEEEKIMKFVSCVRKRKGCGGGGEGWVCGSKEIHKGGRGVEAYPYVSRSDPAASWKVLSVVCDGTAVAAEERSEITYED